MTRDSVAQDQIVAFFERWQRLEEEKRAIGEDLKELFAEAKGIGFDTKVMRRLFRDKVGDQSERAEFEALYELYATALGMPIATGARPARADKTEPAHSPDPGVAAEGEGTVAPGSLADQSTAARKDVPRRDELAGPVQNQDGGSQAPQNDPAGGTVEVSAGVESAGVGRVEQPVASPRSNGSQAGTQAPPVDTKFAPGSVRYEHAPPEPIVYHEITRCFPEASNRDFAALVEAIKGGGEIEPILMQGNILLDGRARYTAARQAKADYPVEEYAGDDPLSDIIKLNMASRKLNLVERQAIAKKLIKLCPDREADIGELLDLEQQREAAQ